MGIRGHIGAGAYAVPHKGRTAPHFLEIAENGTIRTEFGTDPTLGTSSALMQPGGV
jgi:hypothetical protein